MSVEVNPVGMRCGANNGALSCSTCYQLPLRAMNEPIPPLDLDAIKRAVEAERDPAGFSLFGGEPLLAPIETLEKLWAWGLERYGKNGVQTSARPIREEHFALFRRYKVCVSFSIEGPEELNDVRWAGTLEETRRSTAHAIACLERCLREGIPVGLITTLQRHNATAERLPRLLDWFRRLDGLGLGEVGLHVLEHDGAWRHLALTHEENFDALLQLRALEVRELRTVRFGMFRDILALLRGKDAWTWKDGSHGGVSCVWSGCDPWTTPAVRGVNADGTKTLCQRVHKTPVQWAPGPRGPLVRVLALRETPQDAGGCQGCRHLITCKGQCPGTAIGGDWRKRSRDCELWYRLLTHFEGVLLEAGETPVTLRADRDVIEERMARHWATGRAIKISGVLDELRTGKPAPSAVSDHDDHQDHDDHEDHHDLAPALAAIDGEAVRA